MSLGLNHNITKMASVEDIIIRGELRHLSESRTRFQSLPFGNFTTAMAHLLGVNFSTDMAESEWMQTDDQWEPALGTSAQGILIALYSVTTLLSVAGNLLVLVVLSLGKHLKTELKVFLINLALADLAMASFCMPFTFTQVMLGRWVFGAIMCPLVLFMQVLSVAVSIFTNMAIGIDRLV